TSDDCAHHPIGGPCTNQPLELPHAITGTPDETMEPGLAFRRLPVPQRSPCASSARNSSTKLCRLMKSSNLRFCSSAIAPPTLAYWFVRLRSTVLHAYSSWCQLVNSTKMASSAPPLRAGNTLGILTLRSARHCSIVGARFTSCEWIDWSGIIR